ncbi:MAG TPA: penicillin-binding transpeptidase domain-containing protein [Solirubrobacteraceae bacterium]|nr:penicillin-binding transpeptidase domain-containing protein [Solirubrobacteraceae bacterium]
MVVLAVVAFVAGVVLATRPGHEERQMVTRYVTAWGHRDYAAMYALLDTTSRGAMSESNFARALETASGTATLRSVTVRHVAGRQGNDIDVTMLAHTKLWGTLHETLVVPLTGSGSGARVHYSDTLLFPGLLPGEKLHRVISLAPRGTLEASDGTPLAQGPDRTSPIPDVASQIVGTVGPIPGDLKAEYAARGYPTNAHVGLDGLELIFQDLLAGTPGGRLLAGHRVLASAKPIAAKPVRTTISPSMERAAVAALGGQYGGMVVMNPRTGAVLAAAGIAYSALQPPGSTMKIITATAALQAHLATLSTTFPYATEATIEGYQLQNANGEDCGGTLINSFAVSCNSVFAPLGAKLGGKRLVAMAQRFGFNQPSSILGAAESTIPSAQSIGDDLAVGSSAIGQGLVQTTPLEMTDVAATIAMGGRRPIPTLLAHQRPRFVRVTSAHVANEVQQMMVAVVQYGTGTSAQISGVQVAGKTGTAELKDTAQPSTDNGTGTGTTPSDAPNPKNTDAWFVGYAPVGHPRVVAGALFPNQGAGGGTAAPPVRQVLETALSSH